MPGASSAQIMPDDPMPAELPFTSELHVPPHSADGVYEIRDAAGRQIALIDPHDELDDPDSAALVAESICRACNMHERLLAVCEAIQDSFDANGDYRYHTAEYSIAELVTMARGAVAESIRRGTAP